jgi:DNA-binding IclR family transcriptional regulator
VQTSRGQVPAAEQTLRVLTHLARHAGPLPAGRIATDLGLPRSTTYHLLAALIDSGFVVHLPEERRYGLGVAAFEVGSAYTHQAPLARLARPLLAALVDDIRRSAHLAVLHGREVLYVVEERATGQPSLVTEVGVRLPAQLTASGRAMLAALPPAQVRALFPDRACFVQRHGIGPQSLSALRQVLGASRARGFAVENGEVTPGLASIGVAVLDHSGHPAAGLAITYPTADQCGPSGLAHSARSARPVDPRWLADQAVRVAQTLARRIGGQPGR